MSVKKSTIKNGILEKCYTSVDELRQQYIQNKNDFESKQYTMNIDQIILNNIILKVEEDVYFGNTKKHENELQRLERQERNFMRMFTCCDRSFDSFNEFYEHKEKVHNECCEIKYDSSNFLLAPSRDPMKTSSVTKKINTIFYNDNTKQSNAFVGYIPCENETNKCIYIPLDDDKPFKCNNQGCEKSYTSSYGLRCHIEKNHGSKEDEKPYKCQVAGCEKKYKNSNGLKYHMNHNHK